MHPAARIVRGCRDPLLRLPTPRRSIGLCRHGRTDCDLRGAGDLVADIRRDVSLGAEPLVLQRARLVRRAVVYARQFDLVLGWARPVLWQRDPARQLTSFYDGRGRFTGSVINTGPKR